MPYINHTKEPPPRPASWAFPLTPPSDPVSNITFLRSLFTPHEGALWVAGFVMDPGTAGRLQWRGREVHRSGDIPAGAGMNTFFCISTFERIDGHCPGRTKGAFEACHVLVIDDVGTKVDPALITLAPSYVLQTSPGNYQVAYLLDEPCRGRERVERVLSAMVERFAAGEDPGMKGVTRYVRLPVGVNTKPKHGNGAGPPAHVLVHWDPELRYSIKELVETLELDLSAVRAPGAAAGSTNAASWAVLAQDAFGAPDDGVREKGEDGTWFPVTCPWVSEHTGGEDSGTAVGVWPDRIGFKCNHGHCQGRTWGDVKGALRDRGRAYQVVQLEAQDAFQDPPAAPTAPQPPPPAELDIVRVDAAYCARQVPPRPWIQPGELMRGAVTLEVGPPGIAKSATALTWATALAAGEDLLGRGAVGPFNVLVWNNEDPEDEVQRRIQAIHRYWAASPGALYLTGKGANGRRYLGQYDQSTRRLTPTAYVELFIDWMIARRIDVFMLDPLASLFRGAPENDNLIMGEALDILDRIARSTGAAIQATHHMGKGKSEDKAGDLDAFRGASALIAAARFGFTFARMSKATAEEDGISPEVRLELFRRDNAKTNYSRMVAEEEWYRLVSGDVGNGADTAPVPIRLSDEEFEDLKKGTPPPSSHRAEIVEVLQEIYLGQVGEEPLEVPRPRLIEYLDTKTQLSERTWNREIKAFCGFSRARIDDLACENKFNVSFKEGAGNRWGGSSCVVIEKITGED